MAALIASILGRWDISFHITASFPVSNTYRNDRATGGFKGPNDLGGFLIAPLMWLIQGFITDKFGCEISSPASIIFVGLLLTFSRGAWGSGVVSLALLIYFLFVTQTDRRSHKRILCSPGRGRVFCVRHFHAAHLQSTP